jgi:hypothetical protein
MNTQITLLKRAWEIGEKSDRSIAIKAALDRKPPFATAAADQVQYWKLRALSALEADDPQAGWEAAQKLKDTGSLNATDPSTGELMANLNLKGWLNTSAEAIALTVEVPLLKAAIKNQDMPKMQRELILKRSSPFSSVNPSQSEYWALRAELSVKLSDVKNGWEAGKHLSEIQLLKPENPEAKILALLKDKGWLTQEIGGAEQAFTAEQMRIQKWVGTWVYHESSKKGPDNKTHSNDLTESTSHIEWTFVLDENGLIRATGASDFEYAGSGKHETNRDSYRSKERLRIPGKLSEDTWHKMFFNDGGYDYTETNSTGDAGEPNVEIIRQGKGLKIEYIITNGIEISTNRVSGKTRKHESPDRAKQIVLWAVDEIAVSGEFGSEPPKGTQSDQIKGTIYRRK